MTARTIPALDLHFPTGTITPGLADQVSLALDDLAPAAVHESGSDEQPVWRIFLSDPSTVDAVAATLTALFASHGVQLSRVLVEDEDWAARSQAHLTRVVVGRVVVAPPWDAVASEDDVLVIVYPSTGFGTGHHETTRLALRLLQQVELTGRRMLDLGTGSGVLAVTGWKLGASEVEGLDYDADAVVNAVENVRLNAAETAVTIRQADLRVDSVLPADVVTANLTGGMLILQADLLATCLRPGGNLIVSGILGAEVNAVATSLQQAGLTLDETLEEGAWRAMLFSCP